MWIIFTISMLALAAAILLLIYALRAGPQRRTVEMGEETEITLSDESDQQAARPLMPRLTVDRAQIIGSRENQEDSCGSTDPQLLQEQGFLAVVADGIGGLDDGQVASQTAVRNMLDRFKRPETFRQEPAERLLNLSVQAQNDVRSVNQQGRKIGSTLITAFISGWKLWHTSVGDSRICLYRNGGLIQLNRPHVLGKEQDEIGAFSGQRQSIDARRAKSLTAYLGKEDLRVIDRNIVPTTLCPGDRLLLMSDGVFGTLPEEQIASILEREKVAPAEALVKAVSAAARPAQDNATAVVVSIN